MTLGAGSILENRYRIESLLGQGGMGAVYRAYDIRLQQAVAIKENTIAMPGISPEAIVASQRQFEREALTLARLRHPHLPRVSDHFVTSDDNQYLVMDFIEGENLTQIVARSGPLPEAQAVAWIGQVCSALEYLHSLQPPIIHRDIKPQNIKVTPEGQVFLVDFGIAKVGEASKTTTGALGVTPGYSPPEQYGMGGTDARSDIYALGATLYTLLTGQTPPESMTLISEGKPLTPPSAFRAGLGPQLERTILKAMEPRKTDRPQSVTEFRQMLAEKKQEGRERGALPPTRLVDQARSGAPNTPPATARLSMPAAKPSVVPIVPPKPAPSPAHTGSSLLPLMVGGVILVTAVLACMVVWALLPKAVATPVAPTWQPTTALAISTPAPPTALPQSTPVPPTQPPLSPTRVLTPALAAGATRVSSKDGMVMVYVPAGEFLMGSTDGTEHAEANEKPQHKVYVDAFWVDQTEVTNAQYAQCVQAGMCQAPDPSDNLFNGDDHPVINISWDDATHYCEWAGRQLPTEAQWEKAARGTDGRTFPWGNAPAVCDEQITCGLGTRPVGISPKGASPYGALDMAGNAMEWVADWYAENYYAVSPSRNPQGPESGQEKVYRGGGWNNPDWIDRSAGRFSITPESRRLEIGFRCVSLP